MELYEQPALEEDMLIILAVLALVCAVLGIYLLLVDSNLLCIVIGWWNRLIAWIDPSEYPFGKAVILLAFALLFAILYVIFDRRRRGVIDPAKN